MTKPSLKAEKFSSLSEIQIDQIIENSQAFRQELAHIASNSQNLINSQRYLNLAPAQNLITQGFLNENIEDIAKFLCDCRLIGIENEDGELVSSGNYVIGSEGVALIAGYLKTKPRNQNAHQVEIVKNKNLETKFGSRKVASIFMEQKGIHDGLKNKLNEDLKNAANEDFEKTYLIETFGSTGSNHWICLTIRKKVGETTPLVDLFDPSPGLVRGNLESSQNPTANGWNGAIAVNATLSQTFRENGLTLLQEKFFYNMEALQAAGHSNCSIFSYEKAFITANMTRKEHEALLRQHYKYPNPFGATSEIEIDLEEIKKNGGKVINPQFNLPPAYMFMSHFNSNIEKFYEEKLQQVNHQKKGGGAESQSERRKRYLSETTGSNDLITQKMLRQKYGHLFEIVTSQQFLELAQNLKPSQNSQNEEKEEEKKEEENPYPQAKSLGSYYFPKDAEFEKTVPETQEYVEAIAKILRQNLATKFNVVNCSRYDEENKSCEIVIYLGDISAGKMANWARKNGIDASLEVEGFGGFEVTNLDSDLGQRTKLTLRVPTNAEMLKKLQEVVQMQSEENKKAEAEKRVFDVFADNQPLSSPNNPLLNQSNPQQQK